MADAASYLILQFLDWLDAKPRSYAETMEAWRSTCPRLSIWEDALGDQLVRLEPAPTRDASRVVLTAKGASRLSAARLESHVSVPPTAVRIQQG